MPRDGRPGKDAHTDNKFTLSDKACMVWGSRYDPRVLLNATVLLRDGKPATDMNMNILERLLLSKGLKEVEGTDIYGTLKEYGVIPTTDENRDVTGPDPGAVWPGIH